MLRISPSRWTLSNWFVICKKNISKIKRKYSIEYTCKQLSLNNQTEKSTQSFLLSQIEVKFEVIWIKDSYWVENE
jgi:hypothetical protein